MGRTHVGTSENSLLKDFSSLSSDRYSLGMVGDNGDPALPPIGKGSRLLVRLELLGSNQTNGHRRYFFRSLAFTMHRKKTNPGIYLESFGDFYFHV